MRCQTKPTYVEARKLADDTDWEEIAEKVGAKIINRDNTGGTGEMTSYFVLDDGTEGIEGDWVVTYEFIDVTIILSADEFVSNFEPVPTHAKMPDFSSRPLEWWQLEDRSPRPIPVRTVHSRVTEVLRDQC